MIVRETLFIGGIQFFPYQIAFGISIRWGNFMGLRLYFGPIKIWLTLKDIK